MKNRKNGFTLIEMLVCIGIIGALGIVIGLSANTVIKNAKVSDYEEIMSEVFDAAMIYVELSEYKTNTCNIDSGSSGCTITIGNLISKGLLDENYYNKYNPMYRDKKFSSSDQITVEKTSGVNDVTNGVKDATMACSTNTTYNLKLSGVKDYNYWGKC